jgi:hypothetical protein
MTIVVMMVGSIMALMTTIIAHVFVDINLAQTALVYFGTGALTILLAISWSRISLVSPQKASLTK